MTTLAARYASSSPSSPNAGKDLAGWIATTRHDTQSGIDSYLNGLEKTGTPPSSA